jgi:hypothetical protein
VSLDAQEGGLEVEERKEKFLSNIVVVDLSSEVNDPKSFVLE